MKIQTEINTINHAHAPFRVQQNFYLHGQAQIPVRTVIKK